jgi:hypothetical protein
MALDSKLKARPKFTPGNRSVQCFRNELTECVLVILLVHEPVFARYLQGLSRQYYRGWGIADPQAKPEFYRLNARSG